MTDTTSPTMPTETRMHRFRVGDIVALQNDGHHTLSHNDEGTITAITNAEGTYISVKTDDDKEYELTEDEVRRVG